MEENYLKKLMEKEKELYAKRGYENMGWEAYELNLTPSEIRKMMNAKYISIVYKSHNHTDYKFNTDYINEQIAAEREVNNLFPQEDRIPDNLFDSIYGYDDVKFNIRNFIEKGARGGFLFIGPPASAKTLFLMEVSRLPKSTYITASSSTKIGMRDILMDDEPKYLCIDELDKASNRDYDILLSLLETGIVQKNLHDDSVQKILKTQVFAAANRDDKIPPEIRSRFIVLHFKRYTNNELRDIGISLLTSKEKFSIEDATKIVDYTIEHMEITDVRDFLKISRLIPHNDINSINKIVDFLNKYK